MSPCEVVGAVSLHRLACAESLQRNRLGRHRLSLRLPEVDRTPQVPVPTAAVLRRSRDPGSRDRFRLGLLECPGCRLLHDCRKGSKEQFLTAALDISTHSPPWSDIA